MEFIPRTDLKPCPFCGGEASLYSGPVVIDDLNQPEETLRKATGYVVNCNMCDARMGPTSHAEDGNDPLIEVIVDWNTRSESAFLDDDTIWPDEK